MATAQIPSQNEGNVVHMDENWRQRVNSEKGAAAAWSGSWGFLQKNPSQADVGVHQTHAELDAVQNKIQPCYKFLKHHQKRVAERRSIGNMIMDEDKPGSRGGSRSGSRASRPGSNYSNDLVKMDASTALSFQPQYVQGVGACIMTPGVNPNIKYKHPQTSQQVLGFDQKNLEFFGVSQHGRKSHARNAQYDM